MRRPSRLPAIVAYLALFLCVSAPSATLFAEEHSANLGGAQSAEWKSEFEAKLNELQNDSSVSPEAYAITMKVFARASLSGTADEAASFVFSIALRADRALRRGRTPGEVMLEAKRMVANFAFGVVPAENAQVRLRRHLSNMGDDVLNAMEKRPGPQGGPSSGRGRSGSGGGGTQTGPSASNSGSGTGFAKQTGEEGQ